MLSGTLFKHRKFLPRLPFLLLVIHIQIIMHEAWDADLRQLNLKVTGRRCVYFFKPFHAFIL
jgi:hypothetical protein